MELYYYLDRNNNQCGPVEVNQLLYAGVTPETLVWKNGMEKWQPAHTLPELTELFISNEQTPPTPPVPPNVDPTQEIPNSAKQYFNQPIYNNQQYGQQNNRQMNQPGNIPAMKPDNYLVWAILATVLCCLPLGVAAIVYSNKVDSLWNSGRYEESIKASKTAKNMCIFSVIGALVFSLLYFIIILFSL